MHFAADVEPDGLGVCRVGNARKISRSDSSRRRRFTSFGRGRPRVEKVFSRIEPEDAVLAAVVRNCRCRNSQCGITACVITSAQRFHQHISDRFAILVLNPTCDSGCRVQSKDNLTNLLATRNNDGFWIFLPQESVSSHGEPVSSWCKT